MNGDQIRVQLDLLEAATVDLAEGVIGILAEIRARLTLLEASVELSELSTRRRER